MWRSRRKEGIFNEKKILSLTLSAVLALGATIPARAAAETYADGEAHTIGVIVYDPDSSEMEMFSDYYRDYIQAGFPVKFIFSGKTTNAEEEIQYIDKMKEQALEYGHSETRELSFLVCHGLLHLLGYDHMKKEEEQIMFEKQDKILERLGITR